ncbi:MAG: hypothetical protein QM654_16430 [Dysgonamonadaceae bacterium]
MQQLTHIQKTTLEKIPSFQNLLLNMKPANLLLIYSDIDTVEQSVSENRLTIEDLDIIYKSQAKNPGFEYIEIWLSDFETISNIKNPLQDKRTVALFIYKEARKFYFSDMKVIFESLMRGEYGPFYGSVDATRIYSAFTHYRQTRIFEIEKLTQAKKKDLNADIERVQKEAHSYVHKVLREKYGEAYKEKFSVEILFRKYEYERDKRVTEIKKEYAEKFGVAL